MRFLSMTRKVQKTACTSQGDISILSSDGKPSGLGHHFKDDWLVEMVSLLFPGLFPGSLGP